MNIKELALKYFPHLWGLDRLKALVDAGKMSKDDYKEITGEEFGGVSGELS